MRFAWIHWHHLWGWLHPRLPFLLTGGLFVVLLGVSEAIERTREADEQEDRSAS